MVKQTVTRRQKDISRLIRDKDRILKDTMSGKPFYTKSRYGTAKRKSGLNLKKSFFTREDIEQIKEEGLTAEQIKTQMELFNQGVPFLSLDRPCLISDGIERIPAAEQNKLISLHEEAAAQGRLIKFVPASGAASRMFKDWYQLLGDDETSDENAKKLASNLPRYAFYQDLADVISKNGGDLEGLLKEAKYKEILSFILTEKGLNYGPLPKAIIKFHKYREKSRTAIEEHLVETALYVRDANRISRLHITVSKDHRAPVGRLLT
ncbi:MAG: DUF4301 family protein, partial [Syntrophales bacterium]|nr:DUF4301 family protein [Syntrophales bacterium]